MQLGYFKAAWSDIRHSSGWLKKLLFLSLVACIPAFGWIVVCGYLFGWARDMAWGVHGPLPRHVFGNEDGKLYVRGLSVVVITAVFSLLPLALYLMSAVFIGGSVNRVGILSDMWNDVWSWWFVGSILEFIAPLSFVAMSVLALLFAWVGGMRASIYGRVSAGFQLSRIWAMIRHDSKGILRILGMVLLWSILCGLLLAFLIMIVVFVLVFAGLVVFEGSLSEMFYGFDVASVAVAVLGVLTVSFGIAAFASYLSSLANVFIAMLYTRALGYWVLQFDVPRWQGQEDPMPFETEPSC